VSFRDAAHFWTKLGFINFGGPAGQIAIMHEEIVDRRKWVSNSRFLHALNFCLLLPGPEAQQLAIYLARVCQWTYACSERFDHDFHPNTIGYAAITRAFEAALATTVGAPPS